MCANLARLEDDLKALEEAGCNELHFDIMDGIFVPNITLGAEIVKTAKRVCNLPCNAHLMIVRPEDYIRQFVDAGCDSITVHVEACRHAHRVISQIREAGASPGLAINPATSLTKLDYLIDYVDRVLVMSVDPGYAGQKAIPGAFERIRILKENLNFRHLKARIEVDGNITVRNAATFQRAGAEMFILGTASIFTGGDLRETLPKFRAAVAMAEHLV
jgi:ribulose-phosphate 3-epimerase